MPHVSLPAGDAPEALSFEHFPTPHQAVVWRNWGLVAPARLASVLGATPDAVCRAAADMGLHEPREIDPRWIERGYVTLIRNNWHLLPYDQLLELLDWSEEELDFALREDDFLWHKLGNLKPRVERVALRPLSDGEKAATEALRSRFRQHFPDGLSYTEAPFAFLDKPGFGASLNPRTEPARYPFGLRMAYAYAAVCGDPLLDPALDPYPDSLLEAYAANGVNAVWLHGLLYNLTPILPEVCGGYEQRLANLRRLVERAGRFGVKVFLYLNEPRGMPPSFFENRPDWRGAAARDGATFALCTSNPEVLEYVREASKRLATEVPDLGGVFTITMSENLTNCFSKGTVDTCPRCAERSAAEVVAEVNGAIESGIHAGAPEARVVAWTWAWRPEWTGDAIDRLPAGVELMCVSEWGKKIRVGGVEGSIVDYSISQPGPSDASLANWRRAKARGLKTWAKVQMNNSWECSTVPWLPVPHLVDEHLANLEQAGVDNLMLSWTLGGYPGGNLPLLFETPAELATGYSTDAATAIETAWRRLADAFREFPFHVGVLYCAPQNAGPRNLLFARPTGYRATMVGIPYDDLERWRAGHYPPEVFVEQCRKLTEGWSEGLEMLRKIDLNGARWEEHLRIVEAAGCHFQSMYQQSAYVLKRDSGQTGLTDLVSAELETAKRLFALAAIDSRIGFEASNHYSYTLNDLAEKVLNCAWLQVSKR